MAKKITDSKKVQTQSNPPQEKQPSDKLSTLEKIPITYQELMDYYAGAGKITPFDLRFETFLRIEKINERPLLCYVSKTHNLNPRTPSYINDNDLNGFDDLVQSIKGKSDLVDIFMISNGGSAEASERIVRLLRANFKNIRFIIPANAFSAATLICFSGDQIIMGSLATLGPIDPQINGVPARAILRAFETIEKRLKEEGPKALTAYMPLISKYDLHILEICKSAEELSKELAANWLSSYMLKCDENDDRIKSTVDFFLNFDFHKSHGRSIDRDLARGLGLEIAFTEDIEGLADLVRSLYNQYEFMFDKSPFYKMYENAHGIKWGRQSQVLGVQLPIPTPQGFPAPGT